MMLTQRLLHSRVTGPLLALPVLLLSLSLSLSLLPSLLFQLLITVALSTVLQPHFGLVVEHLYPLAICRFFHIGVLKIALYFTGSKYHSTFIDNRTTLAPGVFIHPIPNLADNYCYAIIRGSSCVLIDVGDAAATQTALQYINDKYEYTSRSSRDPLTVTAVISTHKHWDHTAGNASLLSQFPSLEIYGANGENVPNCTNTVKNGDTITLLDGALELEVIGLPCHTRGSIALRAVASVPPASPPATPCAIFTGDALFCGGCGAPFEAGFTPSSALTTAQCMVKILLKGGLDALLFPGHEYTRLLLGNQQQQLTAEGTDGMGQAAFFEVRVAQASASKNEANKKSASKNGTRQAGMRPAAKLCRHCIQ